MYRLVVYELIALLVAALGLSAIGALPFSPLYLGLSVFFLFAVSWTANSMFAAAFDAPSNPESTWITALILALIISPPTALFDPVYLPLAFWAAAVAAASKYIFAIRKKHLFNPAAFGVAATSIFLGLSASWWVGTLAMLPFVLLGGLFVVRKIRRFDLWIAFVAAFFVGIVYFGATGPAGIFLMLQQSFVNAPAIFFATVMLTEPLTTPPTRTLRILYGALVGLLFLPQAHLGSFYLTPEIALLLGNLLSYLVSPKRKLVLTLKEKIRLSHDVAEFVFEADRPFTFKAGQYLEWTLEHDARDSRGIRRYFTIASSPTEDTIRLGVKFYMPASSFKKRLARMRIGETLVASQLAGDFTLPASKTQKLAFIAGGIGITPFRSQLRYLIEAKERRDIALLYANKSPEDAVYRETIDEAAAIGAKTLYAFTDPGAALPPGAVRALDARAITNAVPDFKERMFYISGPQGMVSAYKTLLLSMGVSRRAIKTDYFPGFA